MSGFFGMSAADIELANQERERQQRDRQLLADISLKDKLTAFFFRHNLLKMLFEKFKEVIGNSKRLDFVENEFKKMDDMARDSYWLAGVDYQRIQSLNDRMDQIAAITQDLTEKALKGEEISDKELLVMADKCRGVRDAMENEQKRYDALIEIIDEEMDGGKWNYTKLPDGRNALICPERATDKDNEKAAIIVFDEGGVKMYGDLEGKKAFGYSLDAKDNSFYKQQIDVIDSPGLADGKGLSLDDLFLSAEIDMTENAEKKASIKDHQGYVHDMYQSMLDESDKAINHTDAFEKEEAIEKMLEKKYKEMGLDSDGLGNITFMSKINGNGFWNDVRPVGKDGKTAYDAKSLNSMSCIEIGNRECKSGLMVTFEPRTSEVQMISFVPYGQTSRSIPIYNADRSQGVLDFSKIPAAQREEIQTLAQSLPDDLKESIQSWMYNHQKINQNLPQRTSMTPKDDINTNIFVNALNHSFGDDMTFEVHNNMVTAKDSRGNTYHAMMQGDAPIIACVNDINTNKPVEKSVYTGTLQSNAIIMGKDLMDQSDPEIAKIFTPEKVEAFTKELQSEIAKEADKDAAKAGREDVGEER